MELWELLEIRRGVTALIGSGGKTTMLYTLAEELQRRGRVLCCTTTHIRPPTHLPVLTDPTAAQLAQGAALPCLCAGSSAVGGKLGPLAVPMEELAARWDYVLVEADGSRGLPLKAHAPHEPVIPDCAGQTVLVVGSGGLGRPVRESVHRPEIFCRLARCGDGDAADPARTAAVIRAEGLGDKVFLNQADRPDRQEAALALAERLDRPAFIGALKRKEWRPCAL